MKTGARQRFRRLTRGFFLSDDPAIGSIGKEVAGKILSIEQQFGKLGAQNSLPVMLLPYDKQGKELPWVPMPEPSMILALPEFHLCAKCVFSKRGDP